ncbi:MAG: hypothetical protein MZV70_19735 [Desulfobacterales bacterium]|nr:hypothetical protein [Desulfobacterales bacterium]
MAGWAQPTPGQVPVAAVETASPLASLRRPRSLGFLYAAPGEPQAPARPRTSAPRLPESTSGFAPSTLTAASPWPTSRTTSRTSTSASDDDWRVLLLDAAAQPIGMRLIGNPYRFSPRFGDEQALPLTIKVLAVPALACRDHSGPTSTGPAAHSGRQRVPGRAAAARARFLAHDGENRRLIREAAARRATSAARVRRAWWSRAPSIWTPSRARCGTASSLTRPKRWRRCSASAPTP